MREWMLLLLTLPALAEKPAPAPLVSGRVQLAGRISDALRDRSGLLVLIQPNPEQAQEALRNLLAEDDLVSLDLPGLVLELSQGSAPELRPSRPYPVEAGRWVLLGPSAAVVADGPGMPSPVELVKAFQASGCRPRLAVLRAFVGDHPEHLGGVLALLRELKREGDARTRACLGNGQRPAPTEPPQVAVAGLVLSGAAEDAFVENQAELTEKDDELIWAETADLLERRLPDLLAMATRIPLAPAEWVPECLWASARLQASAARVLPAVETALAGRPSDLRLWGLWLALRGPASGTSMAELLANLLPSPLTPARSWPPPALRAALLRDGRSHGQWQMVVDLAEPVWRELRDNLKADPKSLDGGATLAAGVWSELCEPLLEALLRLNRAAQADDLLREWLSLSRWRGAVTRAQTLALDCGDEALLARWSHLLTD